MYFVLIWDLSVDMTIEISNQIRDYKDYDIEKKYEWCEKNPGTS